MTAPNGLIRILLVEDNPGDANLTKEALQDAKVLNEIHWVTNGEQAMDFLHRRNGHESAPRPDLMLLDLNLPRKGGLEVLADVKADQKLKLIPVVILTSSEAERDVISSYNNHAACYVTKPVDLDQFLSVVKSIEDFWLAVVKLPPR